MGTLDLDALERLARLREQGALSEDEFQAQKARLASEPTFEADETASASSGVRIAVVAAALLAVALLAYHFGPPDDASDTDVAHQGVGSRSPAPRATPTDALTTASLEPTSAPSKAAALIEIDGEHIPKVFRGQWGTSKANCAGEDDYGPMVISSKGFSHYEVTADADRIVKTRPDTVEIEFTSIDIGSGEPYNFRERWTYDASRDRYIAMTFGGESRTTTYERC